MSTKNGLPRLTCCDTSSATPSDPYPTLAAWPALVVDLAQQLYDGAEVRLVLHDALLDAGHAELAEHFRVEEWHPKGCWVVDLVTGRR